MYPQQEIVSLESGASSWLQSTYCKSSKLTQKDSKCRDYIDINEFDLRVGSNFKREQLNSPPGLFKGIKRRVK